MNKILNNINIFIFILFSLLIIVLFLFLQIFSFDYFLFYNIDIFYDHLIVNDNLSNTFLDNSENTSLNNKENTIYSDRSSCSCSTCSCTLRSSTRSSSLLTSEHIHRFSFINKYKEASKKIFNKFKYNINNKAKYAAHKVNKLDKTLSWFFKGSKPEGGRGL